MKLLLVNLGGLGDIVMMSSLLGRLKSEFDEIHLLAIKRSEELAKNYAEIDKFHTIDEKYYIPSNFFSALKTFHILKKKRFDYLINLRDISSFGGELKIKFMVKMIRPIKSVGRSVLGYGKFYDIFYEEELLADKNEVELTFRLLEPLGIKGNPEYIRFPVKNKDRNKIFQWLKLFNAGNRIKISLNPGAFRESRRWPISHWKELIRLINEKYSEAEIFINGNKKEMEAAKSLKISKNVHMTHGLFSMSELAALFSYMDVSVSNDSGLMHLAAAAGSKIVAVFSGWDEIPKYLPYINPSAYRIATNQNLNLKCKKPCYKNKCPNPICLINIEPEYVFGFIEEFLK